MSRVDNDIIVLDPILEEERKASSLRANHIWACLQKRIQNTG